MGWRGKAWLEREERAREERTDLLLAALALRPDTSMADISAGSGIFSRRMASAVMPSGTIWVVAVQPEIFSQLQAGAKRGSRRGRITRRRVTG
jgi:predicted methyltransferase